MRHIIDKINILRYELPQVDSSDPKNITDYVEVASITYKRPIFFGLTHETVTQNIHVRGKEPVPFSLSHYLIGYKELAVEPGQARRVDDVKILLDDEIIKDYSAPVTNVTR